MRMKKLLTFLTLLTLSIGVSWAAETFTMTFQNSSKGNNDVTWNANSPSTFAKSGIHWTHSESFSSAGAAYGTSTTYAQIGTKNKPATQVTLSTTELAGKKIVSATLNGACSSNTGPVLTITAGSTTMLSDAALVKTTATDYTSTINNVVLGSGEALTFTIDNPTNTPGYGAGINIYSITVVYDDAGDIPQTPTHNITYDEVTGGTFSGPASAAEGSTVTITPNPAAGYAFSAWNVTDASGAVTVTDNQFTMGTSDVTVSGSFTLLPTYGISVTNGVADVDEAYEGQTVTLLADVPDGKVVDLASTTITPSTVTLSGSGDTYTFTMPNEAVTVAFAFKDAPLEATYIFNTDEGLAALGIQKPESDFNLGNNTYTVGPITLSTTDGNTPTRIWNSSGNTDLRVYKNGGSIILTGTGVKITKIELTGSSLGNLSADGYSDGTWTGEATSVTLTATGTANIKTITVTYAEDANPPATVDYYLVGNINDWDNENLTANSPYKFTKQNDGSYTLNVTLPDLSVDNDLVRFKIAKVENGTPTWYGGSGNGDYGINRKWGNNTNITFGNGDQAFTVPDCYQAIFTLDAENMKFSVDKPQLYMIGTFNSYATPDNNTDNGAAVLAPDTENGGWTLTKEFAAGAEFRLYDAWHVHHGGNGWWIQEEHYGTELDIANDNQSIFHIVNAGNYTITVNSGLTKLKAENIVEKYTATIASGINGGSVSFNENYQRNTLSDITEGQTVNVYVTPNTDYELASLTYTAEGSSEALDITATEGQYSFTMPAANVTINATFNYTGTLTETTYQLITSNDKLEIGSKYIIVNNSGYALGIVGSDKNKGVAININNNTTVITSNSGVSEFTLGTVVVDDGNGNEVEAYSFKNGNNYLTNASGTGVTQSEDGNKDWSINIDNGIATIQNGGTQRYLRFYVDSKFFRAYTSTTQSGTSDIQIYKEVVEEPATEITLAGLVELGAAADGKKYCISDENGLLGVYKSGNTVWFKDEVEKTINLTNETLTVIGGAVDFDEPGDEQNYWIENKRTKDFDQSNWIEVDFTNVETPEAVTGQEPNVYIKNLTGTYSYNGGKRKLVLTKTPDEVTAITNPNDAYVPNPYIPANFYGSQQGYFFSKPKVQEYAKVVDAQWNGTKMVMGDNNAGFVGSFTIEPVEGLTVGNYYTFHGIISRSIAGGQSYSTPRLQAEGDYDMITTDLAGQEGSAVTAISTVGVNGEVKSVKYVNVAGVVSDRPFQGVNIVVTEYTDGSRTTAKVVK